ncbi:MAG: HAMP domain-containing histidine kinase [Oscillospiraceae bacterium]|nr:HAMP domain-containing histidine kinase [Oscillospiraceae bacterium]
MKNLNNPEVRRELIASLAVTAVFAAAGFVLLPLAGWLILCAGLCLTGLHLYFTKRRYDRIADLSRSIDFILHGQDEVLVTNEDEGELAILVSEVRKMTVRLREQTDQLKADKVRLTAAIEDIFHQLRTPLTAMNITASLLSKEGLTPEKRLRLTRDLKRQLERTGWLVETLLKMSKIDSETALFREDMVMAAALIEKAAAPFVIPMELRGQTFNVKASGESFKGDMDWSAEALGNILKNAMEHTPEGGEINVTAAETPIYTEFRVTDSGEGFDPEDIPNLFRRFYRGKNASDQSIGIGLALARMIIARQNGTVTASNRREGGAEFLIRFYKTVI